VPLTGDVFGVPSRPIFERPRSPLVLVTTVVTVVDVINGCAKMAVDLFIDSFEMCLSSARNCILVASVSPPDEECMTVNNKDY